jgi:hypothetical protein
VPVPLASLVAGAAVTGALLAVLVVLRLRVRLRRLERACDALLAGGPGAARFVSAVRQAQSSGDDVRREVAALRAELAQARADLGTALRHVAVVRYDAFDDLAGRLSFSAALLDDAGDGVVVTSINGRSETRTYAKGVTAGGSPHPLSPEEREAVARARTPEPAGRARGSRLPAAS